MNVRGHTRRAYIVQEYEIKPVLRSCIPPGAKKESDAGGYLTDEYYVFEFKSKSTGKTETATVGLPTARDFLLLAGQTALPRFDPFKDDREEKPSVKKEQSENKPMTKREILLEAEKRKDDWNPEALELYEAIMLLQMAWNISDPEHILVKMSEEALKYYSVTPYLSRIEKLNNIIAKDYRKRKMGVILKELRRKYPDLKYYGFALLKNRLAKENIPSNF